MARHSSANSTWLAHCVLLEWDMPEMQNKRVTWQTR